MAKTNYFRKSGYRCPLCLSELGRISIDPDHNRYFTSLPGICIAKREGNRYEVHCRCGHIHRFIGAEEVIRFRIVQ